MRVAVRPSDLLATRLERFARVLPGVERGDIKSLHHARVASRRLRELVPVLQLPPDVAKKLSRRLRKVTKRLGRVRELDVMLLLIDELHVSRPMHAEALSRLRLDMVKRREAARKRQTEHMSVDDLERIAKKLKRLGTDLRHAEKSRVTEKPERRKAASWATDARTAKRAARLSAAMASAGAVYLPERLHDVRLALKKLRYVLELAAELNGQKNTPELRTLKRGQDLLGRMHDVEVLIGHVRDVQASIAPPNVASWRELDTLVVSLENMCRTLHARYLRNREAVEKIASSLAGETTTPEARPHRRAG